MKLKLQQEKVQAAWYDVTEKISDNLSALCKEDVDMDSAVIHEHLVALSYKLDNYFPDITDLDCQLFRNPFKMDPKSLPKEIQEEFFDFVNDSTVKDSFVSLSLTRF